MTNHEAEMRYKGHGWLLAYSDDALVIQKDDSMDVFENDREASLASGVPFIEHDGIYYVDTKKIIFFFLFPAQNSY